jgi:hypothetical protein
VVTPVALVLTTPQRSSATQFRLISPGLHCPLLPRRRGRGFTPRMGSLQSDIFAFFSGTKLIHFTSNQHHV